MKNRTAKAIDFTLGIFAVIFYAQIRLIRAFQLNKGLPSVSVWSQEPEMVKKDITLLSSIWLNTALFYFFGFWITLIIFASIILGFMIKKKFFPILVLGFLAFSCSKEANQQTYIYLSSEVVSVTVDDITLTESDTIMLPKGKTKYNITTKDGKDGLVEFIEFIPDGSHLVIHDHYTSIHGFNGKFRR